jgi:hypothetical protein
VGQDLQVPGSEADHLAQKIPSPAPKPMDESGHPAALVRLQERQTVEVDDQMLAGLRIEEVEGFAQELVRRSTVQTGQLAEPTQRDGPGPALVRAHGGRLESPP